jgi:hypothetical protein
MPRCHRRSSPGHIRRLVSIAIAAMIQREYAERLRQRLD